MVQGNCAAIEDGGCTGKRQPVRVEGKQYGRSGRPLFLRRRSRRGLGAKDLIRNRQRIFPAVRAAAPSTGPGRKNMRLPSRAGPGSSIFSCPGQGEPGVDGEDANARNAM